MYKRTVCTSKDGITVEEVNGRQTRDQYVEFALGCHDKRCKFIPEKTVWIEQLADTEDMCFNLKHELIERWLMDTGGLTYNKAHDMSSQVEKRERKTGTCRLSDACKTGEFFSSMVKEHLLDSLPALLDIAAMT